MFSKCTWNPRHERRLCAVKSSRRDSSRDSNAGYDVKMGSYLGIDERPEDPGPGWAIRLLHRFPRRHHSQQGSGRRLLASENKFKMAFMTGADAAAISTLEEGIALEVNDRFTDLFGYSREEACGKSAYQVGYYAESDRERLRAELAASGRVEKHGVPSPAEERGNSVGAGFRQRSTQQWQEPAAFGGPGHHPAEACGGGRESSWRTSSCRRRNWRASAAWPAAWLTISTISSP